MNFELLAEESTAISESGINPAKWHWLTHAAQLRRGVRTQENLTEQRSRFLITHALELEGITLDEALREPKKARGSAKRLACPVHELQPAGLHAPGFALDYLPTDSVVLTLRFRLLSPLLTRDDDPFYLFDNPVRKDHIFGVPHLAASSVKGLAADAFLRGFPGERSWKTLGDSDQVRTREYRRSDTTAKRLFGIASDDPDAFSSEAGRLHCAPVWFSHVQFVVMNPTKDDGSGIGTQPIQFESIAPETDKGRPIEADLELLYFNPAGAADSDATTVRADLAALIGALAAWWPALGLGAKRRAGYGAIQPLAAHCRFKGGAEPLRFSGEESWMTLARHIAGGQT